MAVPFPPLAELTGPRTLIPKLLNFMKEYHMRTGESKDDHGLQQLLRDIAEGGKNSGALGDILLPEDVVQDAIKAFEEWKKLGRTGMPCSYYSHTHKSYVQAFVGEKHGEDRDYTLELKRTPERTEPSVMQADPRQIKPRPDVGWYVPPLPFGESEPASASQQPVYRVVGDFDGTVHGSEYLVFKKGDMLLRFEVEDGEGWDFGKVVKRGPGSADRGPEQGWYPPSFA
ncbi:unnamed protein product, partial [Symbiodinium pilosum]